MDCFCYFCSDTFFFFPLDFFFRRHILWKHTIVHPCSFEIVIAERKLRTESGIYQGDCPSVRPWRRDVVWLRTEPWPGMVSRRSSCVQRPTRPRRSGHRRSRATTNCYLPLEQTEWYACQNRISPPLPGSRASCNSPAVSFISTKIMV